MAIAGHPPLRSVREVLPHTALVSSRLEMAVEKNVSLAAKKFVLAVEKKAT